MQWLLFGGGMAVASLVYWARPRPIIIFEDDLTLMPMSMMDKHIQPALYRENGRYSGKRIIGGRLTELSDGTQGTVYLIDLPAGQKILKFFNLASSLLIEANSMVGLQVHKPQIGNYEFKGMMKGLFPVTETLSLVNIDQFVYEEKKGDFCATYSFVPGRELIMHDELIHASKFDIKVILRLLVQLLRQIQGVHFTLNRYPLTENGNRNFLGEQSYANAHTDIHDSNILIDYDSPEQFDAVLIDYGLVIDSLFQDPEDIQIHIYNNILRTESGVVDENKISLHRIFNFGQNMDFCTIAILIFQYYYELRRDTVFYGICFNYRIDMIELFQKRGREVHFMTYLKDFYLYYRRNTNLIPIMETLFHSVFRPMDYSGWVKIVELFDAPL
ncbi:hypothetical protein SNEBB_010740 [Seison nebaliae]|nr:hypothetical protein SNEBB_010740 [Seison nebaliae]